MSVYGPGMASDTTPARRPEVRAEGQLLDPRWEWFEVTTVGDRERRYIKGQCNHLTQHPVTSIVTGELLAYLCTDCDTQLPAQERQHQP